MLFIAKHRLLQFGCGLLKKKWFRRRDLLNWLSENSGLYKTAVNLETNKLILETLRRAGRRIFVI
jgi:hypothetical protein